MKKILITGITGFAGSFLAEHVVSLNNESQIFGTYLSDKSLDNVSSIKDKLSLEKIDLTDFDAVQVMIEKIKPDEVYHLAALPQTAASLENPSETIVNNVSAQINILEAIRKVNLLHTRILIVSSADIYGSVAEVQLPIDEETRLSPTNPYAVSKITQDFLGLQYANSYNMPIIRVRPFNHIGPRQAPGFVISSFAKKIAEIEKRKREPALEVGNLHTKRDFTDVRDMVRAYVLALQKGKSGEVYNIGCGTSYEISGLLDKLLAMSKEKIEVKIDEQRLRSNDIPELRADASKFKELTGWKPEIEIDQTLKDTLEYWRSNV